MDEMEEYRNGLEHRRGERRLKNERRRSPTKAATGPKKFDASFWISMAMFALLGIAMYFMD